MTEEDVVDLINELWDREMSQLASASAAADGDMQAARDLIEDFLKYCETLKITPAPGAGREVLATLTEIRRMLVRVLRVDMSNDLNRKGDLPQVIGLVSRRDGVNRVRDRVIYFAYQILYDERLGGRTHIECADLISRAFEKSGKLGAGVILETDKITKTYQRLKEEIIGGEKCLDTSVTEVSKP